MKIHPYNQEAVLTVIFKINSKKHSNEQLTIIKGNIAEFTVEKMAKFIVEIDREK